MRSAAATATLIAAAAVFVAGCGGQTATSTRTAAPPAPAPHSATRLAIRNFAFVPASLTVKVGTTVTVTNGDSTEHTATAASGAFDTGTLKPGAAAHITLTSPGSYSYVCSFHPFMHGTIVVTR